MKTIVISDFPWVVVDLDKVSVVLADGFIAEGHKVNLSESDAYILRKAWLARDTEIKDLKGKRFDLLGCLCVADEDYKFLIEWAEMGVRMSEGVSDNIEWNKWKRENLNRLKNYIGN